MTNQQPVLDLLDLVVRDIDATLDFYRRLGLEIPDRAVWRTASGAHHVDWICQTGSASTSTASHWRRASTEAGRRRPARERGPSSGSPYHRGRPSTIATLISLLRVTPAVNRRTTRFGAPATL
jgi:catechol 2,3-dioxygenase-like lactoylglutathione lyase family enzyme